MYSVNPALLYAVRALLLSEAGRKACEGVRKALLIVYCVYEFSDHRVLAGSDEVEILSLYLVHHGVHLLEAHDAGDDIAPYHVRRYAVCKAPVYHEISGICRDSRVKSGDISHKIVETVPRHLSGSVHIHPVESLHDLRVIRYIKVRHHRLPESLDLHILGIVLSDGHGRIDDIRNGHHLFCHLGGELALPLLKLGESRGILGNLSLNLLDLLLLPLCHERSNLFGNLVLVCAELIALLLYGANLLVKLNDLIHKTKLMLLEFVFDIFLYNLRIFTYKFDV